MAVAESACLESCLQVDRVDLSSMALVLEADLSVEETAGKQAEAEAVDGFVGLASC